MGGPLLGEKEWGTSDRWKRCVVTFELQKPIASHQLGGRSMLRLDDDFVGYRSRPAPPGEFLQFKSQIVVAY